MFKSKVDQITWVESSLDAVSFLKTHQVDLVISEVEIGSVDGWRLSRLIRSGVFPSGPQIPILLVVDNYCARLAEATARLFDINRVITFQDINHLDDISAQVVGNVGNLNNPQDLLVIEDTEDTAHLVQRMLRQTFNVDIAYDGDSGINLFKQKHYDLVLLDVMMPGLSGEEVLDVLLSLKPNQVVIMMTAHGTVDLAGLMMEKGAADYIQKPFKAEQLRRVCDIASKHEDFMVSNMQFAARSVALETEQQKFQSLSQTHYRILDSLNSVVLELNYEGRISFLNDAWYQLFGFLVIESIGRLFTEFVHDSESNFTETVEKSIFDLLHGHKTNYYVELKLARQDGASIWCELNLSPYYDENDTLIGIAGTIDDISVRKKAETRLRHVALHDSLTGLNNRYYFENELLSIGQAAAKNKTHHCLLYLDLDHFKVINDSQGHHQGDLVLQEIAHILSEKLLKDDLLCRIGGDEFVYLLHHTQVEEAEVFAQSICQAIAESSFQFDGNVYRVSCSIGISVIDGRALSYDQYLQQADIAMFAAKHKGRNCVHVYLESDKLTDDLKQSFDWAQKLQAALVEDNIVIHFQPIIDVKTREIVYYEALVRLMVDNKIVYPGDFIPSLEKAEDMNLLDRHVIGKVLKTIAEYECIAKVAINLSAQAFSDQALLPFIESKLAFYHVDPSRVIFELTETDSLSNLTGTQRMVNRLNEVGCSFSIDDFGTGFSTFAYLKQIPASSVKIDGSFVKDMMEDPTDAALVKAIHETAQALNKKTVAEFVENEAILIALDCLGVQYAQGYHIGKPMPVEVILNKQ
ncbi:EAL domain-containing protein [Algibacillus agarilyticus]|uniref:EAL domain-containing protein n=1 Tax=Algibacillus agarilyticus TaxID=2234133 RepID=UPI0018E57391|nr:EAL domain-containing protein [Algibacillus agarilyticus]